MLCRFCNNPIPASRFSKYLTPNHPKYPKYCSTKCTKRSSYIRKTKAKSSYWRNKKSWDATETGKGYYWEKFVARKLGGEWQGFCAPYDVSWKGKKVDVKSANIYIGPDGNGWFTFHKNQTSKKSLDFLLCLGLKDNRLFRAWIIPYDRAIPHFSIGEGKAKSKYDKYLFNL